MTDFTANPVFTKQINQILQLPSPLQKLNDTVFEEKGLTVFVKRDDLIHPEISGNKWRKLKYNLLNASLLGYKSILTFGGAYSNHIYATAAAGKYFGLWFDLLFEQSANASQWRNSPRFGASH